MSKKPVEYDRPEQVRWMIRVALAIAVVGVLLGGAGVFAVQRLSPNPLADELDAADDKIAEWEPTMNSYFNYQITAAIIAEDASAQAGAEIVIYEMAPASILVLRHNEKGICLDMLIYPGPDGPRALTLSEASYDCPPLEP